MVHSHDVDPIARFQASWKAAQEAGLVKAEAMSLATADAAGRPAVRVVLLKEVDSRGFVFYTNLESRKGRELRARHFAALCFWWDPIGVQVRVEGTASQVSDADADAYFATRPRDSQLAAWASRQSEPLAERAELLARVADLGLRYAGRPVPRPPHWSGFRVRPETIEFWREGEHRLHHRERYTRDGAGWKVEILQP